MRHWILHSESLLNHKELGDIGLSANVWTESGEFAIKMYGAVSRLVRFF